MTLKEFFRKARRGRNWKLDWNWQLRCDENFCPLGAVAQLPDPISMLHPVIRVPNPAKAADKLGLTVKVAWRIARGADYRWSKDRPWLLKNLGIEA